MGLWTGKRAALPACLAMAGLCALVLTALQDDTAASTLADGPLPGIPALDPDASTVHPAAVLEPRAPEELESGGEEGVAVELPDRSRPTCSGHRGTALGSLESLTARSQTRWSASPSKGAITLEGRVVLETGGAAGPGIAVTAGNLENPLQWFTSETDERGRFRLRGLSAGTYVVKAAGRGLTVSDPVDIQLSETQTAPPVVLRVRQAVTLEVTVTDARTGTPLPDAQVWARTARERLSAALLAGLVETSRQSSGSASPTDTTGRTTIHDLAPGEYTLLVEYPGRVPTERTVVVDETPAPVRVELEPAGGLRIQLLNDDGSPWSGALLFVLEGPADGWIGFQDADTEAFGSALATKRLTDSEGRCVFLNLKPATHTLFAMSYAPSGWERAELLGEIDVEEGAWNDVQFALPSRSGSLVGTVRRGATAVSGVPVALTSELVGLQTQTDSEGAFRFDRLEPGSYVLTAEGADPRRIEIAHGESLEVLVLSEREQRTLEEGT